MLAVSIAVSYVWFIFLKSRLLAKTKTFDLNLFEKIKKSNFALVRFILSREGTGDNCIEVLRFKARLARRWMRDSFVSMLLCFVVVVLIVLMRDYYFYKS